MRFRYYLLVLGLLFINFCSLSAQQATRSGLDVFLNQKAIKHASVGICIKDIDGREILAYNSEKSLTPASTLKLVTTASALEMLGADFSFNTKLIWDEANKRLIVSGEGDPTLGSEYMANKDFIKEWTNAICNNVDKQKIDILIDDSYYGYAGLSRKWIREDIGNYFASGSYGISVYDNTYRILINTERNDTCPIIIRTEPVMPFINFENELSTNQQNQDNGYILGEPFSNVRKLVGSIPANKKSFTIKGSIPDPGLYLGECLISPLSEAGYSVDLVQTTRNHTDEIRNLNSIINGKVFYTYKSPALKDIIKVVNVRSNNHYTEHIIRAIGKNNKTVENYTDPLDSGITSINNLWKEKGLDTDALFMYDGCGLAPSDAVSPRFLCDMLVYMQTKSRNADAFFNSLPKAGNEGTVRNFMKNTTLKGSVYVKSGSIEKVRCYAGYYVEGDRKLAFSIMVNNYNGPYITIVKAIEKLLSAYL